MPQREFYIDPLNGSTSYDGTTSAANISGTQGPFKSITNVLWEGGDGSTKGGTGDVFYLVASTGDLVYADDYSSYSFQDTARWGYNTYNVDITDPYYKPPVFIGVDENLNVLGTGPGDPSATRYVINWHNTTSTQREFFNERGTHIWNNVEWLSTSTGGRNGMMYYFTSGGNGPYYINCKFDFSQTQTSYSNDLFSSSNPSASFRDCIFLGPGVDSSMNCLKIGSIYGQHNEVLNCKFDGWDVAFQYIATGMFYGNIIKNCGTGFLLGYDTPFGQGLTEITNNLFYNITNNAIDFDGRARFWGFICNNLMVDIGGYAFAGGDANFFDYGSAQGSNWGKSQAKRNVIQNATQGVYDAYIPASFLGVTGDAFLGNFVDNVSVTGLTLSIDSNFGVTLESIPSSAFMRNSKDLFGATLNAPSTPLGFLLNTGASGESSGGSSQEPEQGRVVS